MFIKYPFEKIGDLATWIGALFSALAFAGTIVLATSASREKSRERFDLAVIVACRVLEKVNLSCHHLRLLDQKISDDFKLYSPISEDRLSTVCEKYMANFSAIPMFSADELNALVALPGRCAARISAARQRITSLAGEVMAACEHNQIEGTVPGEFLQSVRVELAKSRVSLDIAGKECMKAIGDINTGLSSYTEDL